MTASKPKEDLIMIPDRPQSPDYIDMISSRHKKERERKKKSHFSQALSNASREPALHKKQSQFEIQHISFTLTVGP